MPPTNSDSECDPDYVPPTNDHDSDSSDGQDEVGTTSETAFRQTDPAEQKKQRDALWASFQASASTLPSSGPSASSQPPAAKRVKIEKTYLFAGKHVTDVVEVSEDSEDARRWPRWSPRQPLPSNAVPTPAPSRADEEKGDGKVDRTVLPPAVSVDPCLATASTAAPVTPGAKRPGPRKPRTALPSIPKASQPKKITTLDKSAMDWRTHVASQSGDLQDELNANRRGGGYLERVEFLKRVEDRREDTFEASKSSKRRKM